MFQGNFQVDSNSATLLTTVELYMFQYENESIRYMFKVITIFKRKCIDILDYQEAADMHFVSYQVATKMESRFRNDIPDNFLTLITDDAVVYVESGWEIEKTEFGNLLTWFQTRGMDSIEL